MMTPHIEFGGIGLPELLVVAVGFVGDQDFASGTFTNSGKFNTASAREPAPFNTFCGSDVGARPNCSANFSFAFAPPGSLSGASFTIGLFDHDSAAAGDQVALLTIGGVNLRRN